MATRHLGAVNGILWVKRCLAILNPFSHYVDLSLRTRGPSRWHFWYNRFEARIIVEHV
jgi:hypothetical protein